MGEHFEAYPLRDILGNPYLLQNPRSFTSIINRCNLNSKIGQTHIEFLKQRHLLAETENNGTTLLKSTEQANQYITLFNKTYRELFDGTPEFRL